jgi:beta-phosphoglucomutase-like phosphatase (HAD superfamily)
MGPIKGILFEPVGCLAEFSPEPFLEIANRLFGRKIKPTRSASRAYWHVLNLMEASQADSIEALEVAAVDGAVIYDDVIPALAALKALGVKLFIASSLSSAAITRFLERCPYDFDAIWSRDNAGGIKSVPLTRALDAACLTPQQAIFLTDTAEGINVARGLGLNPMLMMNDPDESKRLAMQNPAGGVVSLHELPDCIRFVRAEKADYFGASGAPKL